MIAMPMMTMVPIHAGAASPPEALDSEFLDYLAACEDDAGNWTVVADDALPRKPPVDKAKAAPPADEASDGEEAP